jgi:hypothetical protein
MGQKRKIDNKIEQYLLKGIVEEACPEKGQFISNIFPENKADGDIRVILDLSELNDLITDRHFKMETIEVVKNLVRPGCYMASIDWKDAYYSVKVHKDYRKYLRFIWNGKLYQFTCLPNGLKSAPRIFTKIVKVPFAKARQLGVTASSYIDDGITMGLNRLKAKMNVKNLTNITNKAGFVIHPVKSELEPKQVKVHLGYIIDSVNMTLKISDQRVTKIKQLCMEVIHNTHMQRKITLRKLSKLVGCMVSTLPANQYGRLDLRRMEKFLNFELNCVNRNYDQKIMLQKVHLQDILRWHNEISFVFAPINRKIPDLRLESDASDLGWGGVNRTCKEVIKTGGKFTQDEVDLRNNYLELKAACFTILAFCKDGKNAHIQISVDNKTAVSYLNKQGGRKSHLNRLAREIWKWAKSHKNWISAVYLEGIKNKVADYESRHVNDNLEYEISDEMFQKICQRFGKPDVDLFASRLNNKCKKFISWKADPLAMSVNAFTVSWEGFLGYAFPPCNQIGKVLQKLEQEKAKIILVCPYWPTQPWYTELIKFQNNNNYFFFDRVHITHSINKHKIMPAKKFLVVMIDQ